MYISMYLYTSPILSYFSSAASIAHPTLESYVRIFERSRNSWWFGYGVVRSSLSAVGISRIDILSPSLNSSSTIARVFFFSADNCIVVGSNGNFDRVLFRTRALILPHFPLHSSSLILRLELSTLTRLFNGDQSQTRLRSAAIISAWTYELWSFKKLRI